MSRRTIIRILQVVIGLLLGLAGVFWWMGSFSSSRAHPGNPPSAEEDHFLSAPLPAPAFTLTSQDGEAVSSEDFPGKVLVVFFGYTSCPDVCPLTLSNLTRAFRLMDEDGSRIQVLLITVDPGRDTPERLQAYLRNFHPSFMGLTGTEEEIRAVADGFGAEFRQVGEGESYTVDHTARSFVLDENGEIVLTFPVSASPETMARDLTHLLKG